MSYINIKQFKIWFKIIILEGHQEKYDHIIFQYLKHILKKKKFKDNTLFSCLFRYFFIPFYSSNAFFFGKRNKRKENIFGGLLWFETNLFQTRVAL